MQQEALGLSPTQAKAHQPGADRGGAHHHEGQPERQALRQARTPRARSSKPMASISRRSPRATRNSCDLAAEAKAERTEMGRLRRRATIARNGIAQILETAAEYGFAGEEWTQPDPREPQPRARLAADRGPGGNGARRREPGAAAGRGTPAPRKPACGGSCGCLRTCGFRPQGAGKPAPPIYLQTKSQS